MPSKKTLYAVVAIVATLFAVAFVLRGQGRYWICACGQVLVWVKEAWSGNTSQHLFDPYSFTHLLHGVAFCGLVVLLLPRVVAEWQLWVVVALESCWEVFENSRFVIDRYRTVTAALGYTGDTVVNSLGDIAACALGFLLARKLGWRRSIALFVAVEALLLLWVRDSLLLNIVMLIHPLEAVKVWQAGH